MALSIQGGALAGLSAGVKQQLDNTNYIDFADAGHQQWAQQFMPDIYDEEVQIYGDRTLSGFLSNAGAEIPLQSDQVIWQEQNRLHISYNKCTTSSVDGVVGTDGVEYVINNDKETIGAGKSEHGIRVNSMVLVINEVAGTEFKAIVKTRTDYAIKIIPYQGGAIGADFINSSNVKIFVFGSEFDKGTEGMEGSVEAQLTTYNNRPIIMKDHYGINGTDTGQIGWVKVDTEEGQAGYLWYLKSKSETMLRWKDYLEMTMVEAEKAADNNTNMQAFLKKQQAGTEGFFAAINDRGNIYDQAFEGFDDFDTILKALDTQGAIQENLLYLNRTYNLDFDNMLSKVGQSTGDNGHYGGGSSYGVFSNSEKMALNLGFDGFRRGGYDFYKTDWKYLNAPEARGNSINSANPGSGIKGVLIPAGLTTIYDQNIGSNIKRPFLHIRYRSSDVDNRLNKSWITGSVGARTSDKDVMDIHFLTERMLCVQAANNFVLFT